MTAFSASSLLCGNSSYRESLNDLHLAPGASFTVDRVATRFGSHSRAETNLAGAFLLADLVRIMHDVLNNRAAGSD